MIGVLLSLNLLSGRNKKAKKDFFQSHPTSPTIFRRAVVSRPMLFLIVNSVSGLFHGSSLGTTPSPRNCCGSSLRHHQAKVGTDGLQACVHEEVEPERSHARSQAQEPDGAPWRITTRQFRRGAFSASLREPM